MLSSWVEKQTQNVTVVVGHYESARVTVRESSKPNSARHLSCSPAQFIASLLTTIWWEEEGGGEFLAAFHGVSPCRDVVVVVVGEDGFSSHPVVLAWKWWAVVLKLVLAMRNGLNVFC